MKGIFQISSCIVSINHCRWPCLSEKVRIEFFGIILKKIVFSNVFLFFSSLQRGRFTNIGLEIINSTRQKEKKKRQTSEKEEA